MVRIRWSEKAKRVVRDSGLHWEVVEATIVKSKCESFVVDGEFNAKHHLKLKDGLIDVETIINNKS